MLGIGESDEQAGLLQIGRYCAAGGSRLFSDL